MTMPTLTMQRAHDEAMGGDEPTLPPKPRRRSFSAEYKLAVLEEYDACEGDGDKGALVAQVTPDSAAMAAGIKSGDVIKSVDGKNVDTIRDLTRMISSMKPGTSAKIGLWRDGKDVTVIAKIGGDQKDEAKVIKTSADKADKKAEPLSYGVSLAPLSKEARQGMKLDDSVKGALIASVEAGSPADDMGLKAGDILQQVGKEAVDSPQMAAEKLKEAKNTGKPVLMKVYREGMTRFVAISPRAA